MSFRTNDTVIDTDPALFYLRIGELEAAAWHFSSLNDEVGVCSMRVFIRAHVCGVCLRAIGGGKSEMFKSVGSRYKTKPHQVQMQYMQ